MPLVLAYLSYGLVLGGTAAAQPGPFQAYLLAQTLRHGWRRTLLAAFAPLLSDGPIIALVLLALTQLPVSFLIGLRLLGGLFLLYLAYDAYRSWQSAEVVLAPPASAGQGLLKAAAMNALSPNPYIFWSAIAGPILIEGWRQSPLSGMSFILGFYGTLIGGFIGFIALFATARRLEVRLHRALSAVSALALLGFGAYQLWLGLQALMG